MHIKDSLVPQLLALFSCTTAIIFFFYTDWVKAWGNDYYFTIFGKYKTKASFFIARHKKNTQIFHFINVITLKCQN